MQHVDLGLMVEEYVTISQKGRGRGSGQVCTYFGSVGHTIKTCYKKHIYPPKFRHGNSYANFVEAAKPNRSYKYATSSTGKTMRMMLVSPSQRKNTRV